MSYTPTEWKDGDVITAEKLNKIENGISTSSSSSSAILLESANRYIATIDTNLTTIDFVNSRIIIKEDDNTFSIHYPESIHLSDGNEDIQIHSGNTGQLFFYTPSSGEIRLYID